MKYTSVNVCTYDYSFWDGQLQDLGKINFMFFLITRVLMNQVTTNKYNEIHPQYLAKTLT